MPVEIRFHADLYDLDSVKASAQAFAGLGTFDVQSTDGEILVKIDDIREEAKPLIEDEFCNHVLSGTVNARRSSI